MLEFMMGSIWFSTRSLCWTKSIFFLNSILKQFLIVLSLWCLRALLIRMDRGRRVIRFLIIGSSHTILLLRNSSTLDHTALFENNFIPLLGGCQNYQAWYIDQQIGDTFWGLIKLGCLVWFREWPSEWMSTDERISCYWWGRQKNSNWCWCPAKIALKKTVRPRCRFWSSSEWTRWS